ncbi:MAG: monofunctional biosynthetic peptidoglycan transglycosylase [Gammaproteobacteria bacterium]
MPLNNMDEIEAAPDQAAPQRSGEPGEPQTEPGQASARKRRRWPWIALAVIVVLFLVTWLPVIAMRWANPPTTAFMLETAAALTDSAKIEQVWVPYAKISPAMRLAVVASEDQTFPTNHGFDIKAIKTAIKHNAQSSTVHGASTITQQTAKNLFLWPGGGYFRKVVGAWFTVLIDLDWPKRRVLAMYLNIVQFGPHTFGVEAAAEHYFGKRAAQLSPPEAALLAAALPDPQHLDPAHPSPYLRQRQTWILEQMRHLGNDYLNGL